MGRISGLTAQKISPNEQKKSPVLGLKSRFSQKSKIFSFLS
jgi:hypothetical protein